VEETTAGDPLSLLKWDQQIRPVAIADELTRLGDRSVGSRWHAVLHEMGYSLQAMSKPRRGRNIQPDAQFSLYQRGGEEIFEGWRPG